MSTYDKEMRALKYEDIITTLRMDPRLKVIFSTRLTEDEV
jgi:hypothetical protein